MVFRRIYKAYVIMLYLCLYLFQNTQVVHVREDILEHAEEPNVAK